MVFCQANGLVDSHLKSYFQGYSEKQRRLINQVAGVNDIIQFARVIRSGTGDDIGKHDTFLLSNNKVNISASAYAACFTSDDRISD